MTNDGSVQSPADHDMPDVIPGLADDVARLCGLVAADRDRERNR